MKKAALHNLGCKVNAYETEVMQQLLEEAGYEIVPFSDRADVYIINTCSVTNMAERKSRQMIHRARKTNPQAVIVAAGCYVQAKDRDAALELGADIVLGNNRKTRLAEELEEFMVQRRKIVDRIDINDGVAEFEKMHLRRTAEHTRAFVKVQDGCNQFCSYCIIPYVRGRVRSRDMADVLREIRALTEAGYREVVLTGIHLSSYRSEDGRSLADLIEAVCGVPGISRVRLGSLEPQIVTEAFVQRISALPKVCPHFHLSLQSGCDDTLRRMNRRYTTEDYRRSCELLRRYFARPAITTDVIVGFPGETEEEFQKTCEFLREIRFYEMHVFRYSVREGTRAAAMEAQVSDAVKGERSDVLLEMAKEASADFRRSLIGGHAGVLLEECIQIGEQSYYVGFTPEYVKVAVPSRDHVPNTLVNGRIAGALREDLLLLVEFSD